MLLSLLVRCDLAAAASTRPRFHTILLSHSVASSVAPSQALEMDASYLRAFYNDWLRLDDANRSRRFIVSAVR